MGMAADEFLIDGLKRIADIEVPGFLGHLGEEDHLEEQVSEFLCQAVPILGIDRVHDFIRFFKKIRLDGLESLLAIPWAASGGAEPLHNLDQPRKTGHRRGFGIVGKHGEASV